MARGTYPRRHTVHRLHHLLDDRVVVHLNGSVVLNTHQNQGFVNIVRGPRNGALVGHLVVTSRRIMDFGTHF